MTHDTREVEEVVKEFYKIFDTDNIWQGEDEWTKNVPIGNLEEWLRTTLHHQLQKAREEILKEIDIGNNDYVTARRSVAELSGVPMMAITFDEHIKVIKEKLDHSELDQDNKYKIN